MFIAFEGPDKTGKSTSATQLSSDGTTIHEVSKYDHLVQQQRINPEPDLVVTYDRIIWFGHMVYRLSMPDHDWNDDKVRVVFAMPDTHLVVKLHAPDLVGFIDDELYETGKLAQVNPMYYYFADFFNGLNEERDYALFRSLSLVEVRNDPRDGTFSQRLVAFSSPVSDWTLGEGDPVEGDQALLEFLRHDEHQRL